MVNALKKGIDILSDNGEDEKTDVLKEAYEIIITGKNLKENFETEREYLLTNAIRKIVVLIKKSE